MRKWAAVFAAVISFAAIGTQLAHAQLMSFASQLIDQALAYRQI